MAEVIWAEAALTQLRTILDRVDESSPTRADKLQVRLLAAPELLVHTPRLGRQVPEFKLEQLRELIVRPYRILYWIRDDTCYVVAVIHSKQNMSTAFDVTQIDDLTS